MTATTLNLIDIARLEEARCAQGLAETADESRPWAGGVMGRAAPGNWSNQAVGAGLAGPVSDAAIDELIDYYASKGIEPRVELAPFVDPSLVDACARRGFVPRVFENVFFRTLSPGEPIHTPALPPEGLSLEVIDPADAARTREFILVAMSGFYPEGVAPSESDIRVALRSVHHPRTVSVAGVINGRIVGGGCVEIARGSGGTIAALFGLSVAPEFRRRGIQQALIAHRLALAARRGAILATISSRPGVATERNVRRMGFHVAYTRVAVAKPGEGLVPVAT